MSVDQPGPFYTTREVADLFGLTSDNYLRENIARLPHLTIARQVRFTREHVEAIARMFEQAPTVPTSSATLGRRTRGS